MLRVDVGRRVCQVTVQIGEGAYWHSRSYSDLSVSRWQQLFSSKVADWRTYVVLELVGLSVAGCMLDMNVARVEILVQQAAGAKTLELFGCANVSGERVDLPCLAARLALLPGIAGLTGVPLLPRPAACCCCAH